jgi:hypothetical protein
MKVCMLISLRRQKDFNKTLSVKGQKYKHGRLLKFKIYVLFYTDKSWTVALRQMKFGTVKDQRYADKSYINQCFCSAELFSMAMVQNFEVMLRQTLSHSVHNYLLLYHVVCGRIYCYLPLTCLMERRIVDRNSTLEEEHTTCLHAHQSRLPA